MIDFSTLQGLAIPEGAVTQIEDASGRVIWMLKSGNKVVLQVEKITSDTYAGETTYTGEQFILLDIYPKTNGTVKVTYGGLTKTITDTSGAEEPNAQQVFFGTFNGVSDSVTTPTSGELVIEGDCYGFAQAPWKTSSKSPALTAPRSCITEFKSLGTIEYIPLWAFYSNTKVTSITIPKSVKIITSNPFGGCINLTRIEVDIGNENFSSDGRSLLSKDKTKLIAYPSANGHYSIPSNVVEIGVEALADCEELISVTIPTSVTNIEDLALGGCDNLTSVIFLAETPPTVGTSFVGGQTVTITVPKGCGEAYKTAENWSSYADRIVEAS